MTEPENLSGRTFGEFVLRARIGEGAFGAVYRCEQRNLGREAVVKVLHRRLRRSDVVLKRFQREAQLASLLDHPYAAHVYAFGVEHDDGLFWIAMEMVHGTTLHRWLRERGPLPLAQFVHSSSAWPRSSTRRTSEGSCIATSSPADPDDPGTLTSSIAVADRRHLARLTHADSMLGSPPYMAPEQWTNAVTVGPASDLYALGILAYEAITGSRPFIGSNLADYAELHCEAPVPVAGGDLPLALDPWSALEGASVQRYVLGGCSVEPRWNDHCHSRWGWGVAILGSGLCTHAVGVRSREWPERQCALRGSRHRDARIYRRTCSLGTAISVEFV